ncbi:arylamine N-acetyltransferase family protein [Saccharomonospora saliphila]|uniref:arylamine N-acetyltransferase family protein n=1 Tax=Saccharomonospora saliphila TaxID=369829 RepID=UPI00035E0DBF|nr:arylamine N-acetyltransferase [Saccharomonospora saliphila]
MTTTTPAHSGPTTLSPDSGTHPADEWGIDALDLDAYLDRIGMSRAAPSAAALAALHEAHVRTIPFDNIEPALGSTPSLNLARITDKLVHRRRGGYCYEHALLAAAALEHLGYPVTRCLARVRPDHPENLRTHMVLLVHADGEDHLVDVGFGASMLRPMPLRDGVELDQAGWRHRLRRTPGGWRLDKHTGDDWQTLHAFDDTPQRLSDYVVANHYTATHPDSPFTGRLVAMRLEHGISRQLVGAELRVHHADGRPTETIPVTTDTLGEVLDALGLVVDADDLRRLTDLHRRNAAGA